MATDKKTEEVYCVKYALTKGIVKVVGWEHGDKGRFMQNADGFYNSLSKAEWARTEPEALDLAEALRVKRLMSLENQLRKIESMEIKICT